ncbi:phage integrase central domain-containing protein [Sphingobium yanoikuyae]|uniref:phage integrase central domain-containing protein n=1 Tax=Sphingobium yanoikuyae TaxID=13690 RepID=UPI0039185E3D
MFPHIGHVRANEITGPMIRNALADIRLAKPETARRVRQRIGTVLHWTYASDYRQTEAPMRAITKGLPRQPKQEGHFAAMPLPAWARMFSSRLATGCLSDCASPRTSTACRSTVRPRPSSSKAGRASG